MRGFYSRTHIRLLKYLITVSCNSTQFIVFNEIFFCKKSLRKFIWISSTNMLLLNLLILRSAFRQRSIFKLRAKYSKYSGVKYQAKAFCIVVKNTFLRTIYI